MPCPSGSRILPTSASNGGVAPASVSDRALSTRPGSARAATRVRGRRPTDTGRGRAPRWTGGLLASLVDPLPQCRRDGAGAVTHAELAIDRAEMTLDGLVADHEFVGDGTVGQPIDDERQDLALSLRQPLTGAGPELVA